MTLDFDVLEFCRKLRTSKQPPYTCPIVECGKSYKSMCGLQYHLVIFDHENMKRDGLADGLSKAANTPTTPHTWTRRKKRKRVTLGKKVSVARVAAAKAANAAKEKERRSIGPSSTTELEFEIDDEIYRIPIDSCLSVASKASYEARYGALPLPPVSLNAAVKELTKLPEPCFSLIDDYQLAPMSERPVGYIRFIEKSAEDLDGEVEYDMDEEDSAWLDIVNSRREENGLPPVSVDAFELLMDRLEKESYFQMKTNPQGGAEGPAVIDDDAICCICMDGECQNSNVILFCDMCNLAVHQDCYGVPYIPEGQWLCRRCLHSPSRAVDCVLCPNNGGAFKQTDRGHWAHVVCALWIPEVRFANTVFLEPIDSIETIPPARWKLTCYICKQRGVGACIQCHKTNCYSAFHVTCAQSAGLYMKIDTVKDGPASTGAVSRGDLVQKLAFCATHTPPNAEDRPKISVNDSPRKLQQLAKGSAAPVISLPTIPPDRIQEIGSLVSVAKKNQFIQRLIAYWTLKRQLRNGVPLLRRLQTTHMNRKGDTVGGTSSTSDNIDELRQKLKYWQCLRQDLERARLLCELVRKREKLKRELVKVKSASLEAEVCPVTVYLRRLLDIIRAKDTGEIFLEPVDQTEVPDYAEIVSHPMDLSTMRSKIDKYEYNSLLEFRSDFNLMITNCLEYNSKETAFYRAAVKMREQCSSLFKQAERDFVILELSDERSLPAEEPADNTASPAPTDLNISDFDLQLVNLTNEQNKMDTKDMLDKLNDLLELTKNIKHGQARNKRIKLIKTLLAKIRRSKSKGESGKKEEEPAESSDDEGSGPKSRVAGKRRHDSTASPVPIKRRGRSLRGDSLPSFKATSQLSESFSKYRNTSDSTLRSDEEDNSDDGSSCSACETTTGSNTDSGDTDWSDSEEASEPPSKSNEVKLEQLQLVWAKCRGYPWYPALIINPKMPRGYVHNGVPIPSPPADVIALANNYTEPVYLVLFFDTKRTWQWLPRNKLEPLGITPELDEIKLTSSRKPADRKAVRKAYQDAMVHRTKIDKKPVDGEGKASKSASASNSSA